MSEVPTALRSDYRRIPRDPGDVCFDLSMYGSAQLTAAAELIDQRPLSEQVAELAAARGADISRGPVFNPATRWWEYPIYRPAPDGRRYIPNGV